MNTWTGTLGIDHPFALAQRGEVTLECGASFEIGEIIEEFQLAGIMQRFE